MTACVLTVRLRTGVGTQVVTGIVDRRGVPFLPVHLFFVHGTGLLETLTSNPDGTFTAAAVNTTSYHVADDASGYNAIADASLATVNKVSSGAGGSGPSAGIASLKAQAAFGGVIYRTVQVTGVSVGGCTLSVLTETIVVPTDVMVLALGATDGDFQMTWLPTTTGSGVYPVPFTPQGVLNPKIFLPGPTGTVNTGAGGSGGWGWGWDSPQGGPASSHCLIETLTGGDYAYQSHLSYDGTVTGSAVVSDGPHVTSWQPASLTLSSAPTAAHAGYVVGGNTIRTASGTIMQPATPTRQTIRVPFDMVAMLFTSVGGVPSTTLQSTDATCCLGWTDGVHQASYWVGEHATAIPLQGAGYLSATSLLRFAGAGPAGPSTAFTAVATLGAVDPQGSVTLDWTLSDGIGREIVWFAIGTPSPVIPPAPPGTIEPIRRLRQAPHLWDGTSGHRLKYPGFQLLVEAGAPRDTDGPMSWVLQWSDDGGHSWSHEHRIEGSRLGEHTFRFWWRRLGQSRDRVFRVVNSDDAKIVIIDALLVPDPTEGAS